MSQNRKQRMGVVTNNKMDKTVVVSVERRSRHPVYGRSVRKTAKFHAHDPENKCKIGDVVRIVEARPLSKTKRWRVAQIVQSAE